ncbi:MAG: site-specific DNA-methyltransferase [Pseudomonadales bacterium]|nr:site-specific DNA-methyltransferase [Pseudomonadales bacterium]MBO6596161.1 site-specific DNA-methyltransferase [Pseudomonadales bacterium]MBO6822641.1 site-specific DNA-methyltransferase [Pseudomonadales bacterium]
MITDPPYVGFGFTAGNYIEAFQPYLNEIVRCAGEEGRVAISQPLARVKAYSNLLDTTIVLRIQDAFADHRGDDAYFLLSNPVTNKISTREEWRDVPATSHPNPRDVGKMATLIKVMSAPGDTILDPFCGSGAIGLAAVLLGRNYIGIELDPLRAEDARRRFVELGVKELDWRRGRDSNPR